MKDSFIHVSFSRAWFEEAKTCIDFKSGSRAWASGGYRAASLNSAINKDIEIQRDKGDGGEGL